MGYCPEPDSYIRGKVKVVLDLSKYATKKESKSVISVDISGLGAKRDSVTLKAKVRLK